MSQITHSPSDKKKTFRDDIQGLRAIAVLSVVIFHLGPSRLPGGFIGVDVFFVISGFLIIGHIWRDLQNESFGLWNFYSKRVRRLFPAFLTTAIFSIFLGYFFLLPTEFDQFSKSLIASLFYCSNFFFYSIMDYFHADLQLSPLLHTWSLGVEEQFYFVLPLILMFIFRKRTPKKFYIFVALAVGSFVFSEFLVHFDNNAAFFFSPSRFWQFAVGGICSVLFKSVKLSKTKSELMSALGLGAICFSFFLITKNTAFPGVGALIPTLATAMVLLAGNNRDTLHYKGLSLKPFRFFGDISYSLYLWHWPIIVYYKLGINGNPNLYEKGGLFLTSVAFGYLSWKFVENSSLINKIPLGPQLLSIKLSIGVSVLLALGVFFIGKIEGRFSKEQVRYASFLKYDNSYPCLVKNSNKGYESSANICIDVDHELSKVILLGDSHASHWYSSMRAHLLPTAKLSVVTNSGCKPTVAYSGKKKCTNANKWAFETLLPNEHFDTIILSARWQKNDLSALIKTIEKLKSVSPNIVVLGPIVEYQMPLPRLLASQKDDAGINRYRKLKSGKEIDKLFKEAVEKTGVRYLSILEAICPHDDKCLTVTEKNVPIQFDYGHLTQEGAEAVLGRLTL